MKIETRIAPLTSLYSTWQKLILHLGGLFIEPVENQGYGKLGKLVSGPRHQTLFVPIICSL